MKIKIILASILILNCVVLDAQFKINPSFYGQNFWYTAYQDAPFFGTTNPTTLGGQWSLVQSSGVKMIRVGGHNYNYETDLNVYSAPHSTTTGEITPAGYVTIVDEIRAQGFEPMITVPFRDDHFRTIEAQADTAAEIVRVVNTVHKRNIKYWIISNEPTKDQPYWNMYSDQEIADHIRAYVLRFSVEMKKVDPNILIIGPELSGDYEGLLDLLFADPGSNSASIKGTIGTRFQEEDINTNFPGLVGKYFVDLLSFHIYDGYESTFTGAPTVRQGYTDAAYYFGTFGTTTGRFKRDYDRWVAGDGTVGTDDRTTSLKMVVDEFNIEDFIKAGSLLTTSACTAEVKDANTFLAGQLIVDLMAGMLGTKNNISSNYDNVYELSNLWSVKEEGDPNNSYYGGCFGYLNFSNDGPKSTYWHYYMMANYFKGAFYNNEVADPGVNNPMRCLRAYGCKNKDYIAVIIINQMQNLSNTANTTANTYNSQGSAHTFNINFDNNTLGRTFAFKMGQTTWGAADYSSSIDNKSTSLLIFECNQSTYNVPTLKVRWNFKESDFATDLGGYTISGHTVTGTQSSLPTVSALDVAPSLGNCVTATTSLTAPSASTYSWVPGGQTSQTATGLTAGMYQVKLTGGCGETWLTGIVDGTSPTLELTSGKYGQTCSTGGNVQLTVDATGGSTFAWSPSGGISNTTIGNPTASPSATTTYTVAVTNGGCTVSDQVRVIRQDANTSNEKLYTRDDGGDTGNEPNNTVSNGVFWTSPDIWITQTYSGAPGYEAEYTTGPEPNYIHIKLYNSGSNNAEGLLNVYWAKASTALSWGTATGWINYDNTNNPPLILSDQVGTPIHVTVPASSNLEVILPWFPPNPDDYTSSFGDPNHFCILARLVAGCGITNETSNTYLNCVWSKQVVQCNITVVDQLPGIVFPPRGQIYDVRASNIDNTTRTIKFEFVGRDNAHNENFFDYGHAFMYMDPDLYTAWQTGGAVSTGVTDLGNNLVEITQNNANIRNISITAYQEFNNAMRFTFLSQDNDNLDFDVDLIEKKTSLGQADVVFGGERYVITPVECPYAVASGDIDIGLGCGADLEVHSPEEDVEYTWWDEHGEQVGEGTPYTVYPEHSTYYVLQAARNGCILTDTVNVNVDEKEECEERIKNPNSSGDETQLLGITPNPTGGNTIISCYLPQGQTGELKVLNMYGELVFQSPVSDRSKISIDVTKLANGVYSCLLINKNNVVEMRRLIVNH
jgi:hypothetical protein